MQNELLLCDCNDVNHCLVLTVDEWEGEVPMFTVHAKLSPEKSFWKRIVIALKYVMGTSSNYGFIEIVLNDKSAKQLENFVEKYHSSK